MLDIGLVAHQRCTPTPHTIRSSFLTFRYYWTFYLKKLFYYSKFFLKFHKTENKEEKSEFYSTQISLDKGYFGFCVA